MVVDEELIVGKVVLINKEPYPDHDPMTVTIVSMSS
jgi:hypothetical protein